MKNTKPLNILVILGSTRPNRFGDKPAAWMMGHLRKNKAIKAELVDLRDWNFPMLDVPMSPSMNPGKYPSPLVAKWAKKIAAADGYIIVSPEYNHSYSAVLKNAMDFLYQEWNNKPVGFVSYGSVGGGRAIEHLRGVAVELQMAPIRAGVHIQAPWTLTDEKNNLKPGALDSYNHAAEGQIVQLIWWAHALREARDR